VRGSVGHREGWRPELAREGGLGWGSGRMCARFSMELQLLEGSDARRGCAEPELLADAARRADASRGTG